MAFYRVALLRLIFKRPQERRDFLDELFMSWRRRVRSFSFSLQVLSGTRSGVRNPSSFPTSATGTDFISLDSIDSGRFYLILVKHL